MDKDTRTPVERRMDYVAQNGNDGLAYKKDPIVEKLKSEFDKRSILGIKKYGTTLKDNNTDDFLQHLKEELMDGLLYIQKLQDNKLNK